MNYRELILCIVFSIAIIVIVGILTGFEFHDGKEVCLKKWADSGIDSRYSKDTGCLVRVGNSGYWIPENNYLVIQGDE